MAPRSLEIPRRITTASHTFSSTTSYSRVCSKCTHRSRFLQARNFTSSSSRNSALGQARPAPLHSKQPSMKAKLAHMDKNEMGNDLGRMPNSVVLPASWSGYPDGIKLKAILLWRKFTDSVASFSSLIYATKWNATVDKRTGKSKRKPLEMSKRIELALSHHKQLNEMIAAGNLRVLHDICASGLYNHCKTMIDQAKDRRLPKREWRVVSYPGIAYPGFLQKWPLSFLLPKANARVVCDRASALPFGNQSFIREFIVRINSVQAVSVSGRAGRTQKMTEYIVMQKFYLDGEEGQWRIWGTIDPSKEDLQKIVSRKNKSLSGNTFSEELKARMSTMSGMNL